MVSAAGIVPAIPRSQAECVAAALRADGPGAFTTPGAGDMQDTNPDNGPAVSSLKKLALPVGLAPTVFPQTTGCFSIQLREPDQRRMENAKCRMNYMACLSGDLHNSTFCIFILPLNWEVLVMLQSSLPTVICDTGFTDRQPEHLPRKLVAGVGVAPT